MPLIHVERTDDPRLTVYRDLPKSNPPPLSGRFVVEGRLLVERLAASSFALESVLVDARRLDLLPAGAAEETPVYVVPTGTVAQIVGFNFHRGILACGRRRPCPALGQLLPAADRPATLVVCVTVQDPTNLGGILRNAAAFGVDAVLLGPRCADPFSRRVLRVSMGAVFQLPLAVSQDLAADLQSLREPHAFELIATVLDPQAEPLQTARRPPRLALLLGNEGYGLDDAIVQLCSRAVTISMDRQTDSLNAAVASGVFLYHFTRAGAAGEARSQESGFHTSPRP